MRTRAPPRGVRRRRCQRRQRVLAARRLVPEVGVDERPFGLGPELPPAADGFGDGDRLDRGAIAGERATSGGVRLRPHGERRAEERQHAEAARPLYERLSLCPPRRRPRRRRGSALRTADRRDRTDRRTSRRRGGRRARRRSRRCGQGPRSAAMPRPPRPRGCPPRDAPRRASRPAREPERPRPCDRSARGSRWCSRACARCVADRSPRRPRRHAPWTRTGGPTRAGRWSSEGTTRRRAAPDRGRARRPGRAA